MFYVEFWGVRGSVPNMSKEFSVYGGHTSCVSVHVNDDILILDAGTGMFPLGQSEDIKQSKTIHLFLTHFHFDHVMGLPFFAPIWDKEKEVHIYAGHLEGDRPLDTFLRTSMNHPLFPGNLLEMAAAKIILHNIPGETSFSLPSGTNIQTVKLNHPGGAIGYRINHHKTSLSYITDTEHVIGQHDMNILKFIQESTGLIYDSTYTQEELIHKQGWGHSTWEEAVYLAKEAGVKHLFPFHHEASHTDSIMKDIEIQVRKAFPTAQVARQGMRVTLDGGD